MVEKKKKELILTKKELDKIDKHHADLELKKLEKRCLELELKNLQLTFQLNMKEYVNKIELKSKDMQSRIDLHTSFMKQVASKHKIKGQWSFNPETGEIITGE